MSLKPGCRSVEGFFAIVKAGKALFTVVLVGIFGHRLSIHPAVIKNFHGGGARTNDSEQRDHRPGCFPVSDSGL